MLIQPTAQFFKRDVVPLGNGVNTTAAGTTITPSASANTKGAYAQLIASTAAPTREAVVHLYANVGQSTPGTSWLVDIAIGASGSEVVVMSNLCVFTPVQYLHGFLSIALPISIPAGSRISARCQTNIASSTDTIKAKLMTFRQGFGGGGVDNLNTSLATGFGTTVTPANGSKSAYVQLIAATARAYKGVFFSIDHQNTNGAYYATYQFDFAIGAAGSEVIFLPDWFIGDSGNFFYLDKVPFLSVSIPLGSRISVRAQANDTPSIVGVSAFGVY